MARWSPRGIYAQVRRREKIPAGRCAGNADEVLHLECVTSRLRLDYGRRRKAKTPSVAITAEGPNIPRWPGSTKGLCSARSTRASLAATPLVAIDRRDVLLSKDRRSESSDGLFFFLAGRIRATLGWGRVPGLTVRARPARIEATTRRSPAHPAPPTDHAERQNLSLVVPQHRGRYGRSGIARPPDEGSDGANSADSKQRRRIGRSRGRSAAEVRGDSCQDQ
jgi:hypothetical protein